MQFDISRDFLDGVMIQQPPSREGLNEIRAAGQLHFLPSSPDGTMHTAVAAFALFIGQAEQPFARGGWRFLFTTDAKFDPKAGSNDPFFQHLMVLGTGKIMAQINNLCMHANLPLIPFEPGRMVTQQAPQSAQQPPAQQQQAQQ